MLVPEEDRAALEAEVAELLGILETLPTADDGSGSNDRVDLSGYTAQVAQIGRLAGNAGLPGLWEVCQQFRERLVTAEAGGLDLDDTVRERLEEWPILVIGYLGDPTDQEAGAALITHLGSPAWNLSLSIQSAEALRGMLTGETRALDPVTPPTPETVKQECADLPVPVKSAEPPTLIVATVVEEPAVFPEPIDVEPEPAIEDAEPVAAIADISSAEQALLNILSAELAQMAEAAAKMIAVAASADQPPAVRGEALTGYAEYLERLGDASGSIGLTGLQQVCTVLQNHLHDLVAQPEPLTAPQQHAIQLWPELALDYLRALHDRPVCAALTTHLQDPGWPYPLPTAEMEPLLEQLATAKLATGDDEAPARPTQAQPDDVSLALPADVNPELLDGLLQELPQQTAEFSVAIQRLAAGQGGLREVDVARRIAHTLKGAGNTVGVRGIATLTHQIEDILDALAVHEALPNRPLAETLLNAADCLEAMSEALLGVSAAPPQAQTVLQAVLDWANRLDQTGIPVDDEDDLPPASPVVTETVLAEAAAPAQPQPIPTAEATLRVPAQWVDELLRLVGESIILTGQVQERVRQTLVQTKAVIGQNRQFQQLTSELEQLVDIRNVSSPLSRTMQRGDFDPLELEQYSELNTVTHRLVEAVTDSRDLDRAIAEGLTTLDVLLVEQSRLHRESQEAVLRTRMVPLQTVVPRLQRGVRQTCRLVDKDAELTVLGAETLIDSQVLNGMIDPLMHILRNAVDHGIETPTERRQLGKPPVGRIELSVLREGNAIAIRCQDDGAGLDLAAIRHTALERGLINADQILTDDELVRLILLPGFSTRSAATQTSGRGIGMDMVYSRLLELKGSLRIQTRPGQGSLMELRLPVTLIATHALLVRMNSRMYALSDRGIEQILYSGAGVIQPLGNATIYQVGNAVYELTALDTLLNLPTDRRTRPRTSMPVLLVREETGALRAVLVQETVDSRELVVKPLGRYVPKINGVVGATILGDGSVAPVLDMPELLRTLPTAIRPALTTATVQPIPAAPATHRLFALVVDDSLSARRSLAQLAQDAGLEVRTARDGLEAIELIASKRPDIVLADLEMPRMNGLELAAHLRANQATRDLPIIMITSRSTDKHRREAAAMGVNVYLTKPFAEDELLGHLKKLLPP
jgi:chemosensory pili system protein ChpA (sensor histidine kinase/response regulator)